MIWKFVFEFNPEFILVLLIYYYVYDDPSDILSM